MAQNESTMKFKADVSQLKTAMQEAQRQVKLANAQFKAAASSMDDWSKSSDGLKEKIKQLNKVQEQQEKQLDLLEQELKLTAEEYGENSKEADNLRIKIANQQAAINTTKKDVEKYTKELDECGKETDDLGKQTDDTKGDVKQLSDGFTTAKGVLANFIADGVQFAITKLKDLAKAAYAAYEEFDAGADAVVKATGATGAAAEELEKSYSNVAHNVLGDMEDIGSTLGEVNTRFGWTGEALEDATEQFIKFADITGTDATTSVKLVSRAMENAGLDTKDYKKLLDILAKAGQSTGVSVDSLAESLTKNGATLRSLGYDTEESIAMLAKFEKSGVNTETVLTGMKTAVKKWGKEGKDAKEEYKKVLAEIAKTEDITEANQKAIEAFGTKAGPELVEDIQAGKLEYKDFLDVLKDSVGTVEDTYEQTQDGFDKVKLAIQGGRAELGDYVKEIATKYKDNIVDAIDKVKKGIKKAIEWVVKNAGKIIDVIKTVAKVAAALWVAKKVVAVATAITKVITTVKTLITTLKAGETAMSALSGAGGALGALFSPGGAIVLGIAAIATVTATIISLTKEEARELNVLTDAQKENIKKCEEAKIAYDNWETSRQQSLKTAKTENGRYDELKQELDSLVGANGEVKKGYENRVNYILNEFNQALGTEMQMQDGVIQNYALERQELDKLLEKKKAQAILDASYDAYMDAYSKKTEATKTYMAAQESFNEVLAQTEAKQQEVNDLFDEVSRIQGTEGTAAAREYAEAHKEVLAEYEKSKEALSDSRVALQQATEAYEGYNQMIENYEGAAAAVISGDSKEIEASMLKLESNMKTHTQTTADQLKKQLDETEKYYDDLIKQRNKGDQTITNEMIKNARKLADEAEKEYKQSGKQTVAGYISGIQEEEDKALLLIKQMGYDSVSDLNESLGVQSPSKKTYESGENFAQGFINGMDSKESAIYKKAMQLAQKAIQGLKDGQKEGSPSKITTQSGKYFSEGFINGIGSMSKELADTVKDLVKTALGELGGNDVMIGLRTQASDIIGSGSAVSFGNLRNARAGVVGGSMVTGGGSVVTNNYNLVQNNTSPKALSALDTYRARQQQISLIKAVT